MTMTPRIRKFALTAHVTSSVGWFGAVAAFLALAVAGLTSQDAQTARGAYLAMELTTWLVIIPLAFASLLTGLVGSLGTAWGLFRHYWVLVKLLITVFGAILLLAHTRPIGILAGVARETARPPQATDPTRGRRRRRAAGVARRHDAGGVQAARHDPVRAA
jgi:hypothetical protein